ncbi:MAG: ParA family protein [Planctomycetota bacterium]|nr:ParA family protein [Planctomycetota bacterium]
MRTIAVVAQKGGQGKTTSVVNIAACLAGQGRRVLVLDCDTQANATYVLLRGESPRRPAMAEVLSGDASADDAIVPTTFKGVDLIAAEPSLADVNVSLAGEVGRERRLRSAMADMGREYDVCLLDTGPTRSLLTTNVLNFAAEVVVPISPGVFGVLGLTQLQADMGAVRKFLENKALTLAGVFLVMMERTTVCRDFERGIRDQLGGLVLETTVPRIVAFEEANARQRSIFDHAPKSPGAVAFKALTREVMSRGHGKEKRDARRNLPIDDAAA